MSMSSPSSLWDFSSHSPKEHSASKIKSVPRSTVFHLPHRILHEQHVSPGGKQYPLGVAFEAAGDRLFHNGKGNEVVLRNVEANWSVQF
jgi:hypothetical protein